MLLFVLIMPFSRYWVCKNQKISVLKLMEQCPERQRVEDFGVLRCDVVQLGARFCMFLQILLNTHPVTVQYHTPEDMIIGSPQFVTVCFATIHNNHGFETRNRSRFEHKLFLTQCVPFLSRELVTSQHPYSGGKCPWPYCKHC